jgi:6-hydroxytryprostatin B O-methyltransferase
LADAFPDLRFIVQDLPGPIETARAQAEVLPKEIVERIEFMEHDFFTEQPVKDADVYLLRMIIHDWPDADAIRILKGLAAAMKPGARMVIMDMMLPKPGTRSRTLEAALRQKDLMMRQVLNAKEREAEDWYGLMHLADEGLQIEAIRCPEGSHHSIFEISRRSAVL